MLITMKIEVNLNRADLKFLTEVERREKKVGMSILKKAITSQRLGFAACNFGKIGISCFYFVILIVAE